MSKKLKITEEQLKRLVVNNKNIQEQHESEMNEVGVGSMEIALAKELAPTIVHILKAKDSDSMSLDMDILMRALRHEIEVHKREDEKSVEDSPKYDIPGMEDVMGGLDKLRIREEEPLNESVKEYKNEFDRYLKSPKQ
jgi:hypothetical protein